MKTFVLPTAAGHAASGHGGLFAGFKGLLESLRQARADRALRAELAHLDDHLLRDIGIADDEISRVRARETFTPRAFLG